jgi:hypothetical protein
MAGIGQEIVPIMLRHWILLAAVLTGFFFLLLPASLWLIDRLFRNALEQRLFKVKWNVVGIMIAVSLWVFWVLGF